MRLLAISLCLGFATALPTPYDAITEDMEPINIVKKNMAEIMADAPVPNTIEDVEDSIADMLANDPLPHQTEQEYLDGVEADIDMKALLSLLEVAVPSEESENDETVYSSSSTSTSWSDKSENSKSYHAAYGSSQTSKPSAEQKGYEFGDLTGNILTTVVGALLDETLEQSELAGENADISAADIAASTAAASSAAAGDATASSASTDDPAASSAASGDAAASSAASGEAASSSAASGDSAASSAASGDAASSSAASGDAAASSAAAGEAASSSAVSEEVSASSAASGDAAASSAAAGDTIASSAAAGDGASSSAVSGEAASSSAAAGDSAASSAASDDTSSSSAASGEAASSSAAAGDAASSSAASGEATSSSAAAGDAASSSAASDDAAASSAASGEAASSSAAASDATASSATSGVDASSSAASSDSAASSAASGDAAASSAAAGDAASSSAASGEAASSSAASGDAAASSAASGEAASSSAAAGDAASSSAASGDAASSSAASGEAAAISTTSGDAASSSTASDDAASSSAATSDASSSSSASGEAAALSTTSGDAASSSAASGDAASSSAASVEASSSSTHVAAGDHYDDYYEELSANGTCVPYYLCRDGDIITDGEGLIDIRFGSGDDEESKSNSQCPNFLDVLCGAPLSKPDPEIMEELIDYEYVPSCGHRNPHGVGIELDGFQEGESQFAEFPWMAIILEDELMDYDQVIQRYVCGASLIHPQVVMTGAHCVNGKYVSKLTVRLGDWDTQNAKEIFPHEQHRVASMEVHERFNSANLRYDVALLFLEEPVKLKQHIDTLCLPEEDEDFDYSSCVATGFGKDQFHGGRFQNIMKQVDLSVVPHKTCQKKLQSTRLGRWFRLHSTFTCAGGEGGVDTCRGDGGSPLACPSKEDPSKYVQAGIVAWGIGCGEDGVPGVYASVPKLVKWVNEKIGSQFGPTVPVEDTAYGAAPPVYGAYGARPPV